MVYWYESILLCITSCLIRIYAIDPSKEACLHVEPYETACDCVVFQSYGLSKGIFKSPNYPAPYKPGINCVLYSFIGDLTEFVEIKFSNMNLSPRTRDGCKDRLRIYLTLDRPVVNEHSSVDEEICGDKKDNEQLTFYSRDRALILEFHTDQYLNRNQSRNGFKGEYEFLNKGSFITPGLVKGTLCKHNIQSSRNNTKGKLFSPRFPLKYPRLANCEYLFSGLEKQIVIVTFIHIRLPSRHGKRCHDVGDRITVYDGINNKSKELATFCDNKNNESVRSSGPYMYIEFTSDQRHEKQGFDAEFQFFNSTHPPGPFTDDTQKHDDKGSLNTGATFQSGGTESLECNDRIESSEMLTKKGHITIKPSDYPQGSTCEFVFVAQGPERVQLNFTHMDLYYTGADANDPFSCENEDRVTVYVQLENEDWHSMDTYCGKQIPRQMMSTGHQMKVVYISESSSRAGGTGFKLDYFFRTDYAIRGTGVQDQRKDCLYVYNSSRATSGIFTSPNHPGNYPGHLDCTYTFHGQEGETVNITFDEFDLSDMKCEVETDSDRVSFSNFEDSKDTMLPTYCGIQPRDDFITSEGAFFKVTFKSNEKYDAKGFVGRYNFISSGEVTTTQRPSGFASSSPRISTAFIVTFFLLCKTVITISS